MVHVRLEPPIVRFSLSLLLLPLCGSLTPAIAHFRRQSISVSVEPRLSELRCVESAQRAHSLRQILARRHAAVVEQHGEEHDGSLQRTFDLAPYHVAGVKESRPALRCDTTPVPV